MTELLVCDKIKSTLPEGCLKHILAIESSKDLGWLKVHELAEAVDLYFANRCQQGDRPYAGALGIHTSIRPTGPTLASHRPTAPVAGPRFQYPGNGNQKVNNPRPPAPASEFSKRCFICGSRFHLKNDCPDKAKATPCLLYTSPSPRD